MLKRWKIRTCPLSAFAVLNCVRLLSNDVGTTVVFASNVVVEIRSPPRDETAKLFLSKSNDAPNLSATSFSGL